MDLIASYQPRLSNNRDERLREMQFWTLKVNPDKSALAVCIADSGEPPAVEQQIPFTDFPLPEIRLWLVRMDNAMVVMLPSEY
jgi:hypothetical protein